MTTSGTPLSAASRISASRCFQPECTPPSLTSPIRCTRSKPSSAAPSASLSPSVPSSTASSMRVRSCLTTAPAPRLRGPTPLLPIWPPGSPTPPPPPASSGAGAEGEVAALAVAHLALGQPDREPAGGQLRVRVARPELVEDRRLGQLDGVARAGRRQPPAVEHDEHGALDGQRHARGAASTIA